MSDEKLYILYFGDEKFNKDDKYLWFNNASIKLNMEFQFYLMPTDCAIQLNFNEGDVVAKGIAFPEGFKWDGYN